MSVCVSPETNNKSEHYDKCKCNSCLLNMIDKINIEIQKLSHKLSFVDGQVQGHQVRIKDLEDRTEEVEKKINAIGHIGKLIECSIKNFQDADGTKPYKCPVCDGKGQWFKPPKDEYHCNCCEGKGIVWG